MSESIPGSQDTLAILEQYGNEHMHTNPSPCSSQSMPGSRDAKTFNFDAKGGTIHGQAVPGMAAMLIIRSGDQLLDGPGGTVDFFLRGEHPRCDRPTLVRTCCQPRSQARAWGISTH